MIIGGLQEISDEMEHVPDETTLTVVKTVSDVLGVSDDELPPLSNSIDLDALDAAVSNDPVANVVVKFTYAGLRVTVSSRQTATARPIDSRTALAQKRRAATGDGDADGSGIHEILDRKYDRPADSL